MAGTEQESRAPLWPGVAALLLATVYVAALLAAEEQRIIIALLGLGIVAVLGAGWLGLLDPVGRSFADWEGALGACSIGAALAIGAYFHEDHFVLLLVVTVLLYTVATLGLNIQFGYAGVLNFAGASFFGIGAYTSAVLNTYTAVPHLLVLLIGGLLAAFIGSLLLLPVLRTRGHYAAVVTIAFALLLKTFLEVNDVLGGPHTFEVVSAKQSFIDANPKLYQALLTTIEEAIRIIEKDPRKAADAYAKTHGETVDAALEHLKASGMTFTRQIDQLPPPAVLDEIDGHVDPQHMEDTLMTEGLKKFADPQKALLALIAKKRQELALVK